MQYDHTINLKVCVACNESLPTGQFSKLSATPDGLQYICKTCAKSQQNCFVSGCEKNKVTGMGGYCRSPFNERYKEGRCSGDSGGDRLVLTIYPQNDSSPTHKVPILSLSSATPSLQSFTSLILYIIVISCYHIIIVPPYEHDVSLPYHQTCILECQCKFTIKRISENTITP